MNRSRVVRYGYQRLIGRIRLVNKGFLVGWVMLLALMSACETDPDSSTWFDENSLTISQYLKNHQDEYSKAYRLLVAGKMLNTLSAYNPNGDNYTLFLPTDEALIVS